MVSHEDVIYERHSFAASPSFHVLLYLSSYVRLLTTFDLSYRTNNNLKLAFQHRVVAHLAHRVNPVIGSYLFGLYLSAAVVSH